MTDDERNVWNRACGYGIDNTSEFREADLALGTLLYAHGFICNGGVFHGVVECLSPEQFKAACSGYRYFGFSGTADLLEAARKEYESGSGDDNRVNKIYYTTTRDSDIRARFQEHFQKNRMLYAP